MKIFIIFLIVFSCSGDFIEAGGTESTNASTSTSGRGTSSNSSSRQQTELSTPRGRGVRIRRPLNVSSLNRRGRTSHSQTSGNDSETNASAGNSTRGRQPRSNTRNFSGRGGATQPPSNTDAGPPTAPARIHPITNTLDPMDAEGLLAQYGGKLYFFSQVICTYI